ncbi:peptide deformylase [Anaerosoma tenue]|uniref:peptide deformylase n=1 Tax=Anaerosoma tenue TaxID=2933588 RepID=UPI002260F3C5|nr:peptide deformylase [Anaerosoma tenue]MCK8114162.1 peptide deformylase [Anaerosoma tenue]
MEVLHHPNPVLKGRAHDVDTQADQELRELVRAMAETMYAENGVGLAAPQVGVDKRVIVFDVDDRLAALCNPVITEFGDETVVDEEGCLSVPGVNVPVERSQRVVCQGLTIEGREITIEAEDLLARVLQHEIDHLDGILILDRAPAEMRKSLIKAYNEANNL